MRKKLFILLAIIAVLVLSACGNDGGDVAENEELKVLEVEFTVPEKAEVGETVELKALVTFGDEKVEDADEVNFEYWIQGNKDDSITIDSTNEGDGVYTAEVTFEADGVYEIYAHTTARDMHTMPKKSIIVGDATPIEEEHDDSENEDDHSHH